MALPNLNADFFKASRIDIVNALNGPLSAFERDRMDSHAVAEKIAGGENFNPDIGFDKSFDLS